MARSRGASAPARPTCASAWPAAWRACACGWERQMIDTDDFLADLERHLRDAAERRDESRVRRRGALARVLRHQAAGFAPGLRRHAAAGLVPGRRSHAAAGLVPGRRSRDAGSGGLRPRLFRSGVLAVLAVA